MSDVPVEPRPVTPPGTRASIAPAAASDTTLLRCLGVLLIINSHLEAYYPRPWLAGDGLIGNTLFFSVSGFSLALAQAARPRASGQWLLRRAQRIYPSLWTVLIVGWLLIGGAWRVWRPIDYPLNFLWPTPYTFVLGIVPSYLLFLPLVRINRARVYLLAAAVLVIPYALIYLAGLPSGLNVIMGPLHVRGWLEIVDCLAVMFLGAAFALRLLNAGVRPTPWWDGISLAACGGLYLLLKVLVNVEHRNAALYPLQHVMAIGILVSLYRLAAGPWAGRTMTPRAWRWLRRASDASLEIYFVHVLLIDTPLRRISFPLNVLAIVAVAVVLGIALREGIAAWRPAKFFKPRP